MKNTWDRRQRALRAMWGLATFLGGLGLFRLLSELAVHAFHGLAWNGIGHTAAGLALLLLAVRHGSPHRSLVTAAGTLVGGLALTGWMMSELHFMTTWQQLEPDDGSGAHRSRLLAQLALEVSPALLAGLAMVVQAAIADVRRARVLRRVGLPVLMVGMGLGSIAVASHVHSGFHPSMITRAIVLACLHGGILAVMWPRVGSGAAAPSTTVSHQREAVVIEARALGATTRGRLLRWSAFSVLVLAFGTLASLAELPRAVGHNLYVATLLLVVGAAIEAAAIGLPRLLTRTRVTVRPAGALVERRLWWPTHRRTVPAVDLLLQARADDQGTVLDVGAGEHVAVDLSVDELEAALIRVQAALKPETEADATAAHDALGAHTSARSKHPSALAGVLEPVRLWSARITLTGHLCLAGGVAVFVLLDGRLPPAVALAIVPILVSARRMVRLRHVALARARSDASNVRPEPPLEDAEAPCTRAPRRPVVQST